MTAIQNFVFEDHLVRVVDQNGEPWFVGKDICAALALKNHNDALSSLDADEKGVATTDPLQQSARGGGAQETVIVSEPGVYRLVFRSRKEEAERFKRWLAHEVLPQIRRTGRFDPDTGRATPPALFEIDVQHAPLSAKVEYLRMVSRLRGREAAVAMMPHIGLPDLDAIIGGARIAPGGGECLAHILSWRDVEGARVADLLDAATVPDGRYAQKRLLQLGLRAVTIGEPGLLVSTSPRPVRAMFEDTPWRNGAHTAALRGLSGVTGSNPVKFDGFTSRTLFIPVQLLHQG